MLSYDEYTSTCLLPYFLSLPQAHNDFDQDTINFLQILFHNNYQNDAYIQI